MTMFLVRLVEASRRRAVAIVGATLLLSIGGAFCVAAYLKIDTDTNNLVSSELPWRKQEAAFDRAFPQTVDLIAIVIDAGTPGAAEDAAATLAAGLSERRDLFRSVRRPDGGEFFRRNGVLFLTEAEVQAFADQIAAAQPLIGTIAADPSLRGVFEALDLAAQGAIRGEIKPGDLDKAFGTAATALESALAGTPRPLDWQTELTGRNATPEQLRRFVLVQPELDTSALQPGARAIAAIRQTARALNLIPERGVRVRLTGPVVLSNEQFSSVSQGAGLSTALSLGLVCLWLFLALRSVRLVIAILTTLIAGLIASGVFALTAVGTLNLISVAFAVLFIGIAVDFGIQFSVRYRDERFHTGDLTTALRRAAVGIGGPLTVAAVATAVGFLSFIPTDYTGVSDLGLIAGVSMLIALILNLTVLPALLTVLRPPTERVSVGFNWARPIDRFLSERCRWVIAGTAILVALSGALIPRVHFEFDPLKLQDRHTEAMSTLFDLMANPSTTPYTIDILTASPKEAAALAARIENLPEVSRTITISSFVPTGQNEKLAILADVQLMLIPMFNPSKAIDRPSDKDVLASIERAARNVKEVAARGSVPAKRLAAALDLVLARGAAVLPALGASLTAGLTSRLEDLRLALEARPVTFDGLPAELRSAWIGDDGRARIEVFPKGDMRESSALRQFVEAVRAVAPQATGMPVAMEESGRTVVRAFAIAGVAALVAISLLLLVVLRRLLDVVLVLAPLVLAGLFTLATGAMIGLPLNHANIIALPLLLGIGVAFDIYFVMNWRAGVVYPLQSSTASAILFSALTTGSAFGSLALSGHPGTAKMGELLSVALLYTVLCTFIVLPALFGMLRR